MLQATAGPRCPVGDRASARGHAGPVLGNIDNQARRGIEGVDLTAATRQDDPDHLVRLPHVLHARPS